MSERLTDILDPKFEEYLDWEIASSIFYNYYELIPPLKELFRIYKGPSYEKSEIFINIRDTLQNLDLLSVSQMDKRNISNAIRREIELLKSANENAAAISYGIYSNIRYDYYRGLSEKLSSLNKIIDIFSEERVRKRLENVGPDEASMLAKIAELENADEIIKIEDLVTNYKPRLREQIFSALLYYFDSTRDLNGVKKILLRLSAPEVTKRLNHYFEDATYDTNKLLIIPRFVPLISFLSDKEFNEALDVIFSNDGFLAYILSENLLYFAKNEKDKLSNLLDLLLNNDVKEKIREGYGLSVERKEVSSFGYLLSSLIKFLSPEALKDGINLYKESKIKPSIVIDILSDLKKHPSNSSSLESLLKLFTNKNISKYLNKLGNLYSTGSFFLFIANRYKNNPSRIEKILKGVSELVSEEEISGNVILPTLKDPEILDQFERVIDNYKNLSADMTSYIRKILYFVEEKDNVKRAFELLVKYGDALVKKLNIDGINDIDEIKAILKDNELYDLLLNNLEAAEIIKLYIKNRLKIGLPKPNKNTNLKDYIRNVIGIVERKYEIKINKDLNAKELERLLAFDKIFDKLIIKEIIKISNDSVEKNYRSYFLNEELEKLSDEDISRYTLISIIGSKKPKLYQEARKITNKIFGEEIEKVHEAFNSKYQKIRGKLGKLVGEGKLEEAMNLLEETKNEEITKVIESIRNKEWKKRISLEAYETKDPLKFGREEQMACIYLPDIEILRYAKHPDIILVRYDLRGEEAGSAIIYFNKDYGYFIVDSVEGERHMRNERIYELVYKDLVSRAKDYGAKAIVFNLDPYNETPRAFLQYLQENAESLGLKREKIKVDIPLNSLEYKGWGLVKYLN